jgi:hypothetical protein
MAKTKYTRFEATIKLKGHHSNWGGFITDENLAVLANNGTTPSAAKLAELQPQIAQIKKALLAGQLVETKSAIVRPTE